MFSETDKKVINRILDQKSYGFRLDEILNVVVPDGCYIKIFEDKKASNNADLQQFRLKINVADYENIKDEVFINLFNFNDIIEYLLKENLIKRIQKINFKEVELNEENITKNVGGVFTNESRFDLFTKFYWLYQSTGELSQLRKNNFISFLEKRTKRNANIAIWCCIGTLISALCALYTLIFH